MEQGSRRGTTKTAQDIREGRVLDESSFTHLRDSITEALRILVLRRWQFFIPFCLVATFVGLASHRLTRTYESSTMIERRDHPVLMNLRQTVAAGGFAGFFRPTLARDVTSPESMQEVAVNLGFADDLPRDAEGNLTPESLKRSTRIGKSLAAGIRVSYRVLGEHHDQITIAHIGSKPAIGERIVEEAKNAYVRRVHEKLTGLLHEIRSYFEGAANGQRDKAATIEEELLRFQAENIGVDPTDPGSLKLKITSLESEQDGLTRQITNLEQEIRSREKLLDKYMQRAKIPVAANQPVFVGAPRIVKSAETQDIEREVQSLQAEIREFQLTRRMTDRHPDIIERRKRIARLQTLLQARYVADAQTLPGNRGITVDTASAHAVVEASFGQNAELAALQLEIRERQSRQQDAKQRLGIVDEDITKHETLMNNVFRYRKDYQLKDSIVQRIRSEYGVNLARIQEIDSLLAADESQRGVFFNVIRPPSSSSRALKPKARTVLILSLLAGLAAGAIGVLLKEIFDQTYHTTKQVSRSLGLNILEAIDEIVTSVDRAKLFRRRIIVAPSVVAVLLAMVGVSCAMAYLSLEKPSTYQRLLQVPESLWSKVAGTQSADMQPVARAKPEAGTQQAAEQRPVDTDAVLSRSAGEPTPSEPAEPDFPMDKTSGDLAYAQPDRHAG